MKPVLLMVFDGVIYDYDKYGWDGMDTIEGEPVDGAKKAIEKLSKKYKVKVYSDRCVQKKGREAVEEWLDEHDIEVDEVVLRPVPYHIFIGPKLKRFPKVWKDDYIDDLLAIHPRG